MAGLPSHLCFIGDGYISGYGDPSLMGYSGRLALLAKRKDVNVIAYNLGIVGDTSTHLKARIVSEVTARLDHVHDRRLLIQIGHEDTRAIGGKPQLGTKESLENILACIQPFLSQYKVILVGLAPVYDPQQNQRIVRLNVGLAELARKLRIPFIDIYPALAKDIQYKRELGQNDKIHPMQKGYEKIFQLIAQDRQWWFSANG